MPGRETKIQISPSFFIFIFIFYFARLAHGHEEEDRFADVCFTLLGV